MVDFSIEPEYLKTGCSVVCGGDDAGRGPLAGRG